MVWAHTGGTWIIVQDKIHPEAPRTEPKRILSTSLLLAPFKDSWGRGMLLRTEIASSALRSVGERRNQDLQSREAPLWLLEQGNG